MLIHNNYTHNSFLKKTLQTLIYLHKNKRSHFFADRDFFETTNSNCTLFLFFFLMFYNLLLFDRFIYATNIVAFYDKCINYGFFSSDLVNALKAVSLRISI